MNCTLINIISEPTFWAIMILIFAIAELVTTSLTCIWFAGGAVISLIISIVKGPVWLQIIAFFIVSILLIILTRPFAKEYLNAKTVKTNLDNIIDKKVTVIETIDNKKNTGKIRIGDIEWSARNANENEIIEKGEEVIIRKIIGVTVYVVPYIVK